MLEILSTEELLNKFEVYNHVRIQKGYSSRNVMIASMDIDKWYPTMKIRPMIREIKQMIIDSKIEFKEIDYENASKYLGEKMTIKDFRELTRARRPVLPGLGSRTHEGFQKRKG